MASKLFFTFLLLMVVCFVIMCMAIAVNEEKYKTLVDFYSWGVLVSFFCALVSAIFWIWS